MTKPTDQELQELREIAEEWKNKAQHSRAEANTMRRTVKKETTAGDRCIVRAEVWDQCADDLLEILSAEPSGDDGAADSTWLESQSFYWFDDCGMVRELYNGWEVVCGINREGVATSLSLIATTFDPKRSTKIVIDDNPTRRDVRNLCKALGIALKETGE